MKQQIYLDYAATTPVYPEIIEKMAQSLSFTGTFGNPASNGHPFGQQARQKVEQARSDVASLIGATADEIIWTSGATESNNLALKGVTERYASRGKHIITSQIEHKAILDSCAKLESLGFEVTYLKPNAETGIITPDAVKDAIRPDTLLISLMMVNNEIGTITDIKSIGETAKQQDIFFHVDAAQAAGKLHIDVHALNIDLLSLSAHKVYGPKGIGALYVNHQKTFEIEPQIHGGGHEQGCRSGTLATHQIVGMGEAFKIAKLSLDTEQERLKLLQQKLFDGLKAMTSIVLNGDLEQRVANYLNVSFTEDNPFVLINAVKTFAAVSSGSACNSGKAGASHVLLAIDRTETHAKNAIRFSFGKYTTEKNIDDLLEHLKHVQDTTQIVTFI
ncbi:cysteine desulfurase family protein [Acinetobacter rathckeae]|uniref:cysteine desulfurase family protein n=1 Tax=Acinetobacter rathckeae TaxID=2605272 RepID=UPI0018A289AB|nr:aminotransferase class V-fold PLP-dependent enzyme [Acinetobacter rathckeae]MBF7687266.1 aminotransferase class V-fold PLP-dependent enzyme [Acinetobacter rathckeae]MBF7694381.1 aminotransferase class V-fold PLP-dependent enzyme [Acinetobacter rathckeae]